MAKEAAQNGTAKAIIVLECDPSLKVGFEKRLVEAGFRTKTDALQTLIRDLIAGRFNYKLGTLQSQPPITPI